MDIENYEYCMRLMRLPKKYWGHYGTERLDPEISKPVLKYAKEIRQCLEEGYGLLLWGDCGGGKTATACFLAKCAAVAGRSALFLMARDIPGFIIEKTYFRDAQTVIERALEVDLLIIDELLLEKSANFRDTSVEEIFRKRLMEKQSTVITTNLPLDQIQKEYPAFADAMKEACYPLHFSKQTFREESCKKIEKFLES